MQATMKIWRRTGRAVAIVDIVLFVLALLAVGFAIYEAVVTNDEEYDVYGIEGSNDEDDTGWPRWPTIVLYAVFVVIQVCATLLLVSTTKIGIDQRQALAIILFWTVIIATFCFFAFLANFPELHFAAIAFVVLWRGVGLMVIFMFMGEIKFHQSGPSSGGSRHDGDCDIQKT